MRQGGFGGGRDFSGGSRDFEQKAAPVRVGEEVDVTIEAVGAKGDGIAKKEGFVIFVPNASKGDSVRIRITKVLNNMAFAEVAGQGEGGSGQGSSKPKREGRREEDTASPSEEAESVEAPEQQPVDTEDFGEE